MQSIVLLGLRNINEIARLVKTTCELKTLELNIAKSCPVTKEMLFVVYRTEFIVKFSWVGIGICCQML